MATVTYDGDPIKTLRAWAMAYRNGPQCYRFPSDPNAEFFPRDMDYAAAKIETDAKVIAALREALKPFAERGQSKSCLHNDLPGTFSGLLLREFRVARDTYEQKVAE
jgi:hypothetical protein